MASSSPLAPLVALDRAAIGSPITRAGVSLFPVYVFERLARRVVTGAAAGISIFEADVASVPTLTVTNSIDAAVLLVEGESVAGGQQQRTLNVSVLVPPQARLDVPVWCVEAGRWGGGSTFGSVGQASRRVRRAKTASVSQNLRHSGRKQSDQGAVWQSVDAELQRLQVESTTRNLADADRVLVERARLADAVNELDDVGPLPGQCGVVVAHGRRVVAADVFANAELFAAHWPSITRAAILDAPDGVAGRPSASSALRFVRRMGTAPATEVDGVGLGRERHLRTSRVVGQALIWDSVVVHASGFAIAA